MIESSLCYIESDGMYLMLHRVKKQNDVNHDKWIGVGGKLEAGETPFECAVRETLEETGLSIEPIYRGIVDFSSDVYPAERMHLFTATEFSGEMIECSEGTLEWVKISDIPKLPIWEGDMIFLRLAAEGRSFFHLALKYSGDSLVCATLDEEELELAK